METWRDSQTNPKPIVEVDRTIPDEDVTVCKKFLFGVGNGFIDFAGYNVRIVGNLERLA